MEIKYQQRFLQPIQQLALQKEPCEINGVEFFCQQSFYEGQLLNGIDLKVKQMKGLNPNPSLIDYLPDSQQLIFSASSSLVTYNTHKKNYHQLMTLEGEVTMLKVHFDKNNSREYIIWVEKYMVVKQTNVSFSKASLKKLNHQNKKKEALLQQDQEKGDLFKSLFNNYFNKSPQSDKNQSVESIFTYTMKIFDFSRKQVIFERDITINEETMKQVFMFLGNFRMVGYLLQNKEGVRRLYYKQMSKKQTKGGLAQFESRFESIQLKINVQNLKFNNEQYNYVFFDQRAFYSLYPQEISPTEKPANSFQHQLFQNLQSNNANLPTLQVAIIQRAQFQTNIFGMAINDQYLAILTAKKIYFHSAFDTSCLIFIYDIEQTNYVPLGIEFNKSTLYMTFRNIPKITTFTLKSRTLKQTNTTTLELQHCKEIVKIFCNNISSQLFCVIMFYELQSRVNRKSSQKYQPNMVQYIIKPAFIDVSMSFLSPSSKTQAKILNIAKQKYQKVHTCPWLSNYVVEAESQVAFGAWKQNFQNKKCLCLHPTGIYMVVCFKDAFKIYVISFDGLVNTFLGDSLSDIQACALSNLGNDLAIVSSNLIVIYDFYSCKKTRVITLPIGSIVESLQYSQFALCCFLKNKKFYAYDSFNNYQELITFNPKSFILQSTGQDISVTNTNNLTSQLISYISLRSVFYDPTLELLLFSVKNSLYFYNCKTNSIIMTAEMNNITAFYYCKALKTIFLGTEQGELLSYFWPNKPVNFNTEQRKYKLHGGQIISIGVSSDLKEVVTLADDNSLCTCQLSFVQNLKRLQGLQLVEYLSSNVPISYDLLPRKGIYQYTHSKFNQKLDQIKDFEEQTQNMNFILPEQRLKQKEFMLNNIKDQKQQRMSKVDEEYNELNRIVEQIKEKNSKIKQTMQSNQEQISEQLEQLRSNNLAEYMSSYNTTQQSEKELAKLKKQSQQQLAKLKQQLAGRFQDEKQSFRQQYIALEQEVIKEKNSTPKFYPQELAMIDEQKKVQISQKVESLKSLIAEFHANNGGLSCRNNNIQKQIIQLKRRVEERKYLLQRLNESTKALNQEQKLYEQTKQQKERRIVKEDKVNLAEIEKRYVKQTKVLIQKDKQIAILTTNYNKQKGMLIHLEKLLESLQSSIEGVVENILDEKEESKKLNKQIQQIKTQFTNMNLRNVQKKKDKTYLKNNINNFVYTLELALNQIITSNKDHFTTVLINYSLLVPEQSVVVDKKQEEKQLLQKLIQAKLNNFNENSQKKDVSLTRIQQKSATYRKCVTEDKQDTFTSRYKKLPQVIYGSHLKQEAVEKGAKKVFERLKTENKAYERIKTEQIVYENKRKKISLQNEDLIQNYNTLVMQNKKILNLLKKQQSLSKVSLKRIISRRAAENNLTPFQQYVNSKALSAKRISKIVVPAQTYSIDQ